MGKKTYYVDSRLGELRNVKNPHDVKPLDKDTEEAIAFSKVIMKEEPSVREAIDWWENKLTSDERNEIMQDESWRGTAEERHERLLKFYKDYLRQREFDNDFVTSLVKTNTVL